MSRKLPTTPKSRIKAALRQCWLRSRERAAAIKREHGCCEACGAKGRAKDTRNGPKVTLEVHPMDGIDWQGRTDLIARRILHHPDRLKVMCKPCHEKHHKGERGEPRVVEIGEVEE